VALPVSRKRVPDRSTHPGQRSVGEKPPHALRSRPAPFAERPTSRRPTRENSPSPPSLRAERGSPCSSSSSPFVVLRKFPALVLREPRELPSVCREHQSECRSRRENRRFPPSDCRLPLSVPRNGSVGTPTDALPVPTAANGVATDAPGVPTAALGVPIDLRRHSDCRSRGGLRVRRRTDCCSRRTDSLSRRAD
jgi:hypothetical protein